MVLIAPSILSADFSRLGEECQRMLDYGADYLHVDVMDGHFVDNLTIGPPVIKSLRKALPSSTYLDCHLMVSEPEKWIEPTIAAGASCVTIHYEACRDSSFLITLLHRIRDKNVHASIAFKPSTPLPKDEELIQLLPLLDMILIMTVEPGFGGQKIILEALEKVSHLRQVLGYTGRIQVDGGVNEQNSSIVREAGADVLVAGSAIFNSPDQKQAIANLRG